jgi:Predicted nucleotide-binding protein containing TIR-like domain
LARFSPNGLKWGIVEQIENIGYTPEVFTDPSGHASLAAGQGWSAMAAYGVARRCHGAAIIGLPRWEVDSGDGRLVLPSEYCHYKGALARTLDLPLLILAQDDLMRRVVFDPSFGPLMGWFPAGTDASWLSTKAFEVCFQHWERELAMRRDVFLGYSGASTKIARVLRQYLEGTLKVSVLDWQRDFKFGRSVLDEIEKAKLRCTAGIFLFTKDDALDGPGGQAIPRDNVVFETGYFTSSKGKDRVLIVREEGTRLPADLGGDIYSSFNHRTKLTAVKLNLRRFVGDL